MFFHLFKNARVNAFLILHKKIADKKRREKKRRENNFWEKPPDDSADTPKVKNFAEIALFCTISVINVFLCFTQKFKMATKNGEKTVFGKKCHLSLWIPWGGGGQKFQRNHSISHRFRDKCILHRNSRWPPNIAGN